MKFSIGDKVIIRNKLEFRGIIQDFQLSEYHNTIYLVKCGSLAIWTPEKDLKFTDKKVWFRNLICTFLYWLAGRFQNPPLWIDQLRWKIESK